MLTVNGAYDNKRPAWILSGICSSLTKKIMKMTGVGKICQTLVLFYQCCDSDTDTVTVVALFHHPHINW